MVEVENLVYDLSPIHVEEKNKTNINEYVSRLFDNKTLHVKRAKISSHMKHQITFSTETPSQKKGSNIKGLLSINYVFWLKR